MVNLTNIKVQIIVIIILQKDTKEGLSRSHEMTPESKNPYDENNEEIDYDEFKV